jgi:hypothetical protein
MKRNRVEHFYKPLNTHFEIIGATESSIFGPCFVVEASPRERTFRADGFVFDSDEARDSLWEKLRATELKRLAVVEKKQKSKRKGRAERIDEKAAIWDRPRWEYEPDEDSLEADSDSETVDPEIIEVS